MKKIYLLLLLLGSSSITFAQKTNVNDVPKVVVQSYMSQNSVGNTNTIWVKDKNVYKATFNDNGKVWESQYSSGGKWIKTFQTIEYVDVLPSVKRKVSILCPDGKVKSSTVELNNEGKFYVIEVLEGKKTTKLYFTTSGELYK